MSEQANVIASAQSYLFVPATRPTRFASALASGADAVIIDLEDAVEMDAKQEARQTLSRWVSRAHPVLVRINGRATPWFDDDATLGAFGGVAGIVLPKAESADDVKALAARIGGEVAIYPLIESAKGVLAAREIAQAPGVQRLMFGTLDFIAEMGMDDDREALNHFRAQLALCSRAAGIEPPVDGVTPDIHDAERLAGDTINGKRHGFGAKLCIHPQQIATVHGCYRPSASELARAMRILEAAASAGSAAFVVEGKMVDRPVVLRAQRLVSLAASRQDLPIRMSEF